MNKPKLIEMSDPKECEAILRKLAPAARDILWLAICWNDHNFGYDQFLAKADRAAKALGLKRGDVDGANAFLERIDRALGDP
jgi:hypothetical protein